nr:Gag-protease polyprotein [Tanacetum cinerariifolium]
MHNDIKAAGSKERSLMLAPGRYAQWQSRFLRHVDTKSNKKELKQCIFDGPYLITEVIIPAKLEISIKEGVPKHNVLETYGNTTLEKQAYIDAEAEAIHMILSGIRDDIYSIVDACTTAKEMWIAIERLHQGKSINKQDIQKSLALIAKNFKNIYKPTNNNLITSSNTNDKNVDTFLRTGNDSQTGQFMNQRTVIVVGARETIGNQ